MEQGEARGPARLEPLSRCGPFRAADATASVGNRWGKLGGECQLRGTLLNMADGMIAATALEHDHTVVTRNVRDFAGLGDGEHTD